MPENDWSGVGAVRSALLQTPRWEFPLPNTKPYLEKKIHDESNQFPLTELLPLTQEFNNSAYRIITAYGYGHNSVRFLQNFDHVLRFREANYNSKLRCHL